ncbi:MAG: hypothetical protein HN919_19020 [Verrucomicrobia bacterium]|jgi:hypothetical protein|nr:hypothetical protein [Verrucomicrobiota bacterium]
MKLHATPITTELEKKYTFVDNLLAGSMKKLKLSQHMRQMGIIKRSGDSAVQVVFTLAFLILNLSP